MSHTTGENTKGATGSTVSGTSSKTAEQKEKRPHTEVADSSFGDELTSIQKQLDNMCTDIHQTREDLKTLMSKEEMKEFITSAVEKITKTIKTQLEVKLTEKIEAEVVRKVDEKMAEVNTRLDLLTYENVKLREEVDELKEQTSDNETTAKAAIQKANMKEQYSRKNNIKIMGVPEDGEETEDRLIENINHILETKAGVPLNRNSVMAIHRIPGKSGMPKPVLLKLRNNNDKSKIMKKRKEMKQGGYRLVDDVTKENTKLINRLNLHKDIDSAWYFNGSVYGKSTEGRRCRFDLFSIIEEVIAPKKRSGTREDGMAAEPMEAASYTR